MGGNGDAAWCPSCGARYVRSGEGGLIRVSTPGGRLDEVFGHSLASGVLPESDGGSAISRRAPVTVRRARGAEKPIGFRGETLGFTEALEEPEEGILEITSDALILWGGVEGEPPLDQWALLDIRAVQTTSGALQISPITGGVIQFRFQDDSPRRWEDLLHLRIRRRVQAEGLGEILEFQPRIVVSEDGLARSRPPLSVRGRFPGKEEMEWGFREPLSWRLGWYGLLRALAWILVRLGTRTTVRGIENVPPAGPFILVANHQSVLDPILVQVACPRPIHTLTKSTQFGKGIFRWLLPRVNAIPTRRYTVEPQAVRVMIRRLMEGRGVGIYPEGERSWDGVLQPFRRGTLRFLLRAGVPVIPCGVSGTYDVWPRWSRKIRRKTVEINFGRPLAWPRLESRQEAEARLDEASRELKAALAALGAWTEDGAGSPGA